MKTLSEQANLGSEYQIYELLLRFHSGDCEMVDVWMNSKNPLLGGTTPWDMIAAGRAKDILFLLGVKETVPLFRPLPVRKAIDVTRTVL